jgi:hypothetical protein
MKTRPENGLGVPLFMGSDPRRTFYSTQIIVKPAIDCKLVTARRVAPCAPTNRESIFPRNVLVYRRPVKARIIKIKRISPSPPLGQYPQPELYGHAGSAPIKRRIKMINRMVPMCFSFPALCSSMRGILDALTTRRPEGRSGGAGFHRASTSFVCTRTAYSSGLTSRPARSAYTWVNSAPNNRICDE